MDININASVVAEHGQLISQIGSNLGKPFYRIEQRDAWQGGPEGFERDKAKVLSGESTELITNRSPKRFLMKDFLIENHHIYKDPISGQLGIAINLKPDGEYDLFLPLDNSSIKAGIFTAEDVAKALRGEKTQFFLNGRKLCEYINQAATREVENIRTLREKLNKMEQAILNDIANNKKKAEADEKAWIDSKLPTDVDLNIPGKKNVVVTVTED